MIIIELKKALKEGIIIFLILAALVIGILTTDRDAYLAPALELFLLLYASFSGWSIFDREREEGAMEYLLALPVSRLKLFFLKFIPRVIVISSILLLYAYIVSRFNFPVYLPIFDFTVFFYSFFLISLSLSISVRSFIGAFFLTAMLSGGFTFFVKLLDRGEIDSKVIFQSNLILMAFPILFVICFTRFDIKPVKYFNFKFALFAVMITLFVFGAKYLTRESGWCTQYLTDNGQIYRISRNGSELYNKGRVYRIKYNCLQLIRETVNTLFVQSHFSGKSYSNNIYSLNKENGQLKGLYNIKKDWHTVFRGFKETAVYFDNNLYVLLRWNQKSANKYRIISLYENGKKGLDAEFEFEDKLPKWLVHVSGRPLQIIIRDEKAVFQVVPGMKPVKISRADYASTWENKLLIFYNNNLTLYSMGNKLETVFKRNGDFRKVRRRWGEETARKVIIRSKGRYMVFDFLDNSFTQIDLLYSPYYYLSIKDKFYVVYIRDEKFIVDTFKKGELIKRKKWLSLISGWKRILVSKSGIIAANSWEYEKFLFN